MECADTAGLSPEGAAWARQSAPPQPDSLSTEGVDAFQATVLVLVRKIGMVQRHPFWGNTWDLSADADRSRAFGRVGSIPAFQNRIADLTLRMRWLPHAEREVLNRAGR